MKHPARILSRSLAAFAFAAATGGAPAAQGAVPVDLELVLAIDVSGSIDAEEARLQRCGYVDAIADPEVIRAIRVQASLRQGLVEPGKVVNRAARLGEENGSVPAHGLGRSVAPARGPHKWHPSTNPGISRHCFYGPRTPEPVIVKGRCHGPQLGVGRRLGPRRHCRPGDSRPWRTLKSLSRTYW